MKNCDRVLCKNEVHGLLRGKRTRAIFAEKIVCFPQTKEALSFMKSLKIPFEKTDDDPKMFWDSGESNKPVYKAEIKYDIPPEYDFSKNDRTTAIVP